MWSYGVTFFLGVYCHKLSIWTKSKGLSGGKLIAVYAGYLVLAIVVITLVRIQFEPPLPRAR